MSITPLLSFYLTDFCKSCRNERHTFVIEIRREDPRIRCQKEGPSAHIFTISRLRIDRQDRKTLSVFLINSIYGLKLRKHCFGGLI